MSKKKNTPKPAPTAEQPKPKESSVVKVDKSDCKNALEHIQR